MLNERRADFATLGFFYPQCGIPAGSHGHHNLAWQLSGDRRFDPAVGTIEQALNEIAGDERDVVLSAEDFTSSFGKGVALGDFVDRLKAASCEVVFVVYLRNQAAYLRSLYLELVRHGLPCHFAPFLADALDNGIVRWREWNFFVDYRQLIESLPRAAEVRARAYGPETSIIDDFLGVLGLTRAQLGPTRDYRANPQWSAREIWPIYFANRTGAPFPEGDPAATALLDAALGANASAMSAASQARVLAAFQASNAWVKQRYGVAGLDGASPNDSPETGAGLESAFSEATIRAIVSFLQRPGETR